jgi:hypothetical protein
MIRLNWRGRLGNNMIQYAAAYVLAKKAGLYIDKPSKRLCNIVPQFKTSFNANKETNDVISSDVFKIKPLNGNRFTDFIELTDKNYFEHLENPIPKKGYRLDGFFQHKKLLVDYREEILNLYKLPKEGLNFNPSKHDTLIACRFGDCLTTPRTYCSIKYIEKQLKARRDLYDKVYITSDTINHPPLVDVIKKYNLTIYQNEPLDTILFASQFNNLILSAGSFSYWMAYLSSAENITVYHNHRQDPLQRRQNAWAYNKNVRFTK